LIKFSLNVQQAPNDERIEEKNSIHCELSTVGELNGDERSQSQHEIGIKKNCSILQLKSQSKCCECIKYVESKK
jgi:hypothetical protein